MDKSLYKFLKILIISISLVLIFVNSKNNYQIILSRIDLNIISIAILLFVRFISHNILSLRAFLFFKSSSKYNSNLIDWNYLFFSTGLINSTIFWGIGHVIRSYEMKKNLYSHRQYLGSIFFIYFWGMLINSILMLFTFTYFDQINFNIFLIFIILILLSLVSIMKNFLIFVKNILLNINSYYVFNKFKIFDYILKKTIQIIQSTKDVELRKSFINFLLLTSLLFFFDLYVFYLIINIIFSNIDFSIVFIFFALNYLINRIPTLFSLVGVNEAILGFFAHMLGFIFLEGVLFSIIFRFTNIITTLLNSLFYYLIKKQSNSIFLNNIKK